MCDRRSLRSEKLQEVIDTAISLQYFNSHHFQRQTKKASNVVKEAKKRIPKIDIIFDRFHVMVLLNKPIDENCREQQNRNNQVGLKALKGQHFFLLKNFEKLNPKQKSSLEVILETNIPLTAAHAIKKQLHRVASGKMKGINNEFKTLPLLSTRGESRWVVVKPYENG